MESYIIGGKMSLLDATVQKIVPTDKTIAERAHQRLSQLTMPFWALGRLLDLAQELAAMTASMHPPIKNKTIVVMAGDHGVAGRGVSKYPSEVTAQMVANFVAGGAGINALARQAGARVVVVDMGVASDSSALAQSGKIISKRWRAGTSDISAGPAMSREEAVRCIEAGIEVANELAVDTDLFGTGDMGIANTTPSAAVIACIANVPVAEIAGRGTGIDEAQWKHKVKIIEKSLVLNRPNADDGLDVLAKVGGFEIGGLAGLILGAAALKKPVLIDGFISTAAALIAAQIAPPAKEYMIASHRSAEHGHGIALSKLGKTPLLDLNFRLGEGTGAAVAMNLVEAAVRVLTEVATFEEASVSQAEPR
jgi:nicotinate-nucleotide--dimethylbenzimidazole phosphoribosyltransferase